MKTLEIEKNECPKNAAEISETELKAVKPGDVEKKAEEAEKIEKPNLWPHDIMALLAFFAPCAIGAVLYGFLSTGAGYQRLEMILCSLFYGVLGYAAWVDLKTKYVSNVTPIIIAAIGVAGMFLKSSGGRISFVLPESGTVFDAVSGAILCSLPFLIATLRSKKRGARGVGGGDILLALTIGFSLGLYRGYLAILIALPVALIVEGLLILYKKQDKKKSFALVPYLALGCMIAYFL